MGWLLHTANTEVWQPQSTAVIVKQVGNAQRTITGNAHSQNPISVIWVHIKSAPVPVHGHAHICVYGA